MPDTRDRAFLPNTGTFISVSQVLANQPHFFKVCGFPEPGGEKYMPLYLLRFKVETCLKHEKDLTVPYGGVQSSFLFSRQAEEDGHVSVQLELAAANYEEPWGGAAGTLLPPVLDALSFAAGTPLLLRDLELVLKHETGKQGCFFLMAPYTTSRKAKKETVLSAIYGSRLELGEIPPLQPILLDMFGVLNEPIPHMVPILGHAGAGWFAGESGEAFLVPNGWAGLPDGDGPVLNNMSEQVTRVSVAFEAIRRIFDEASANLLLSVYTPQSSLMKALNAEYSFHEAGHASGIGLNHKLAAGVLNSTFFGAIEEWRSDGVAFEAARRTLPLATVGTLIASNFITRFGIDAHRKGSLDLDTDVNSALLLFNSSD